MKKLFAMLLAIAMLLSMAACVKPQDETVTYKDPYADLADDYDALSAAIYADVLGEFKDAYDAAKAATTVSERYALMAIAEAKLMESGVFLPLESNGGNYAISRVAPYTAPNVMWGNDSDRYHNVVVATTPIKPADRETMKAKYNELKGTGTYEAWAKNFLTSNGYTLKDTYTLTYNSDPQTWDVLATYRASDSEAIVNTYDNLLEYDCEGNLKPALATALPTVSADGLVYTFELRQGVKWVDSQGREVGEVTADDFVAGLQHLIDAEGGLESLVFGLIANAYEYYAGEVTDFAEVGVKAVDTYTVQYTLCAPTTYFDTMHGYGLFCPMNRAFYESKGGKFGDEFDASAETYVYGKTPENIAYCGPYLVTNATEKNMIKFELNPTYWNKDNINMKSITWLFNDGEDVLKAYNDCMAGTIDGAGLNASALEKAKTEGNFEQYAYTSGTDATAFCGFINVNRTAMANYNDGTCASVKTDEQAARSRGALYNVHFRRALVMSLDRAARAEQTVGAELKYNALINSYTPGNFVSLKEEVTVKINGQDKTYPAGTYYGEIMQDQIKADGVKITVWDPELEAGAGSSAGFDGWFNADNAKEELAIAIEELKAQGLEISAENPIYIDLPVYVGSAVYKNMGYAMKQSIETVLGGVVIVNIVECEKSTDWYYAGYYPETGADMNYDLCDVSGWGPDFGDPCSYLDTMLPDYMGSMAKNLGLF